MSTYGLNLLTPNTAQAARDLDARDPLALADLARLCTRYAARKAGTLVIAQDVAQVAAMVAAPLVLAGKSHEDAARIATHRATVAALRDAGLNETADRLDDAGESATADGAPLARLAAPKEVRADRGTTYTDRDRFALAADSIAPEHVAALRTMLAAPVAEGQGTRSDLDSLPASALAAAAGKIYSGRAKTAALALKRDALAALAATYATTLTATQQTRTRPAWSADAAALALTLTNRDNDRSRPVIAGQEPFKDQRIQRDTLSRGSNVTDGSASHITRNRESIAPAVRHLYDAQHAQARDLAPLRTDAAQKKAEAGFYAPETGTTVSARPIAGAGRDKDGTPHAQIGQAGTYSGTGTAPAPKRPSKNKRSGAVGGSMTRA